MSGQRNGRRRGLALVAIAACALSLSLAIPGLIAGAGAGVGSPGNVSVSLNLSLVTPNLTLSGISTTSPAKATIQSNGSLLVPRSALVFSPVITYIGPPNPTIGEVSVQLVASSDFSGGVDPATHDEWLSGSFEMLWTQIGTMANCPIGPFKVHVTTKSAGTRPYSGAGTATMVDGNFAIGAVGPNTPGCAGFESSVNTTLGLPITTTTTTSGSSTTTTTTTTTVPTSITSPTALLPDTPVPAVVVSTALTPAPRSPAPPTTARTTTTPTTTTHAAPATTLPKHRKTANNPKPAPPTTHPARHPKAPTNTSVHHKKHHKKHRKHLAKNHPKPRLAKPKPGSVRRPAGTSAAGHASASGYSAARIRAYLLGGGGNRRPAPRRAVPRATPINAVLVSSRHRAAPSALNYLAMLALLVSGAYAVKLMRPDFAELRRARNRPRGRLSGIEPRRTGE